ncbi:DUF4011 domain-containing protein [Thiomicrospira sp. ALE5]|uniref:DUF4011 domain-containing protein n=1 Tax=Thiomicrospira sp. ALE5 TaxID=748650 RepID=UPI0008ED046B|nr:DUF4011 domain-containing protein [Thiomicrospira sp. ALE5]SFR52645.1 AAA domain-containing protein [Thiomicrospira sp. ALE5]
MDSFSNLIKERIEALRPKLQDTSRRNPLINNVLNAKSATFIRIVDEKPQNIFDGINSESRSLNLIPLPPVDIDPLDENTTEFKNAFQSAQATDEAYLRVIDEIDFEYDEKAIDKHENAIRDLKDRVREQLEMPPRPKSEQYSDLINHAKSHGINPSSSLPDTDAVASDDRFEDDNLQTLLLPKTFQSRLDRILSKAKMYNEERGLDVVYIALGYLKWTLPNTDKQEEFKSPVLLLPVTLKCLKSNIGQTYSVTKLSDPILNPSLEHKLNVEAKLDLSSVKNLLNDEDVNVEQLFEKLANLKPKNMQWKVLREATFGIYPFQGIELYYDLDTEKCDFSQFPIVSELMVGKKSSVSGGGLDFSESDVESDVGKELVPHIVLDADSSQFIALLKVANNENVALEGPPGSGKSQTIVNAISNAIYSGKRVLFVAQKVTALEVVLSRLQALSLDQFVLPLMGGYGGSDEFYKAVENRLNLAPSNKSKDLRSLKQQLELHRDKLSSYIELLTKPVLGTGMNVHQVLGLAISNAAEIKELPIELRAVKVDPDKFINAFSPKDLDSVASQIDEWYRRLSETNIPKNSVWFDASATNLKTDKINAALINAREAIVEIESSIAKLDENSRELVKLYLDNSFKDIQYELQEASRSIYLRKVHDLVTHLGGNKTYELLVDLIKVNRELDDVKSRLSLSNSQLVSLSQSKKQIQGLQEFASEFDIQEVVPGVVAKTRQSVLDQSKSLQKLVDLQKSLCEQISLDITPMQILASSSLLDYESDIKNVNAFLRTVGVSEARNEIRRAKSLYRTAAHILKEPELPSLDLLRSLHETIHSGGLFSFLSSKIKQAKVDTVKLLSKASQNDSKTTLLNKLEEVIEVSKTWIKLELSEHFESLNPRVENRLTRLLLALDELQARTEQSGLSELSALKLIDSEMLKPCIELFNKIEVKPVSWDIIAEQNKASINQLQKLDSSLEELEEAEKRLLAFGNLSCSKFFTLIEASDKAMALFLKRSELLEILGPDFEDDNYTSQILASYEDYSSMSKSSIGLILSEEGNQALQMVSDHFEVISKIQSTFETLLEAKQVNTPNEKLGLSKIINILDDHRSDQAGLNSLIVRRSIFNEASNLGLNQLVERIERLNLKGKIFTTAKAAIVSSLCDQIEQDYGALLMQFDGISLNSARSKLQELDRSIIEIAPQEVTNNAIAHATPPMGVSYGRKSEYTDVSLLTHELQKKRRTPPRKILKRAQGALLELFPCWMMVPTAVAQHLPRTTLFDLIIIDEASQMTPENSISALMRGKNALIAGDTNQLPPTNFFKGLAVDEDEDEDVTTSEESILELANVQFHPKHRLLWHYRSKHEDLIAFSNHYVYDNELVIFPSPHPTTQGLGISLVQVNGTFQRGINPAEAQVMLEAIAQFMKDNPKRSLGVAVMNQSQMEQLETLVLREAETNKKVSDYLEYWSSTNEGLEKFFVKNLENVQGDERDVIFVGTVYGRDPQGKFYQRFGPINGPAGKRRLNVLFSRAKEQIVTFSSIPLSDFNPSSTNEGATLLRRWLEFSATKCLGEVAHNHDRAGNSDSPFEDHVIEAVRSLGYEAIPQVGVSSYFIDIGVKHPSYPFGYICGIECDGATYHSSKSARDRDRLREEVLSRLGWNLYRIWSTDWLRDPLGCRELLKTYLKEKLSILTENIPETANSNEITYIENSKIENEKLNIAESPTYSTNSKNNDRYIKLGSRFSVRYLDGPKAGALVKFWLQKTTDDSSIKLDGYTTLSLKSPLGSALEGCEVDEIVSYSLSNRDVRVQVINIELF